MLGTIENAHNWRWAAFGKHPAAGDYFRMGDDAPFFEGLFSWVEDGYQHLVSRENTDPDFCSWRFWARDSDRESLVFGVVRVSSDSFGRPYPLVITGLGPLDAWQTNWDLLPFSCEKTWLQIEFLSSNLFPDLKKLEEEIRTIRPPVADWNDLAAKRKALNECGSPTDPYSSFLDFRELKKLAACNTDKGEVFVSLDRGPCNDKIMGVSLWHFLFRESASAVPNAVFMGGTLEQAYMAFFRRPLKSLDFMQLWLISGIGAGKNIVGTEYSMDVSELGRQPVSNERPTGCDVRYDPAFDELQTEVDKLSSPALAGSVDWEKVCRYSADILAHKSKDLLVASYLAVALAHTRRSDGFVMGLKMYLDIMEQFWEDLHPSRIRMRGRVRAVEWWVEKSETALTQGEGFTFAPARLALVRDCLNKLEVFLSEHLEKAPSLSAIKDYFKASPDAAEEPAQREAPPGVSGLMIDQAAAQPDLQPAMDDALEVSRLGSPHREADAALNDGMNMIRESAVVLFQRDPASPRAYRLMRKVAWCGVEELPPAASGKTRISPPAPLEKNLLSDLRNRGDAESLLKAAEARLSQYIFWLDLNRLSAEALSRLGNRFERAHETVCQETAFLLHRLPGLEELAFSDGTPFANPETRQWLEGINFRCTTTLEPVPGVNDKVEGDATESMIARNIPEIQLLVRKGKLVEATEEMQRRLRGCSSKREMFLWRLELSQMLINLGRSKLAIPHLDQVLRDMDRHELEEYDPALAMKGLRLAWHALQSQAEQRFRDLATDVLHRIGRLDMPEMIRLKAED